MESSVGFVDGVTLNISTVEAVLLVIAVVLVFLLYGEWLQRHQWVALIVIPGAFSLLLILTYLAVLVGLSFPENWFVQQILFDQLLNLPLAVALSAFLYHKIRFDTRAVHFRLAKMVVSVFGSLLIAYAVSRLLMLAYSEWLIVYELYFIDIIFRDIIFLRAG